MLPGETQAAQGAYVAIVTQVIVQTPPPPPISLPPDPNLMFGQLSEMLMLVAVVAGFVLVARFIFKSPIAEAIGERIRRGKGGGELTGESADRLTRIESELGALRGEMSEFAERLDFTERVLAQKQERRLGAGQ